MTTAEAIAILETYPDTSRIPELKSLLRPSISVQASPTSEDDLPLGASRFAGPADVPADFTWPTFNDTPLTLLAQIDFADLAHLRSEPPLPKTGHLLFFYEPEEQPWGFDPKDRGCAQVFYIPADETLERRSPESEPLDPPLRTCALAFTQAYTLPDRAPNYDDSDDYASLLSTLKGETDSHHRLAGHAHFVQNDCREQCALVTAGIYCGGITDSTDPKIKALEATAPDWELLFQIDSDEEGPGWMWGDVGSLYFMIRRQDLSALRFDQVWQVLQCF